MRIVSSVDVNLKRRFRNNVTNEMFDKRIVFLLVLLILSVSYLLRSKGNLIIVYHCIKVSVLCILCITNFLFYLLVTITNVYVFFLLGQ